MSFALPIPRTLDSEAWHLPRAWGAGLDDVDARRHLAWFVAWTTRRGLASRWFTTSYPEPLAGIERGVGTRDALMKVVHLRALTDRCLTPEGVAFCDAYYRDYFADLAELGYGLYTRRDDPASIAAVEARLDERLARWREASAALARLPELSADAFEARLAAALGVSEVEARQVVMAVAAALIGLLARGESTGLSAVVSLKPLAWAETTNPRTGVVLRVAVPSSGASFDKAWLRAARSLRPKYTPKVHAEAEIMNALGPRAGAILKAMAATLFATLAADHPAVEVRDIGWFERIHRARAVETNPVTGATEERAPWQVDHLWLAPRLAELCGRALVASPLDVVAR